MKIVFKQKVFVRRIGEHCGWYIFKIPFIEYHLVWLRTGGFIISESSGIGDLLEHDLYMTHMLNDLKLISCSSDKENESYKELLKMNETVSNFIK